MKPELDELEWLDAGEEPQATLYHYTRQAGLLGIVTNLTLWASKSQYLNDSKEFHHAFDIARAELDVLAGQAQAELRSAFYTRVGADFTRLRNLTFFVCSLSAQRDLLSQWRGYCSPGDAFALGFPRTLLKARAAALGWELVQCVYADADQRELVRRVVEHYADKLPSGKIQLLPATIDNVIAEHSWNCVHHLARVSPRLKHSSFSEEAEWRLVSPLEDLSDPKHKFRPGRISIIPYTEFPLARKGEVPEGGLSVVIGPAPDQMLSSNAVAWFLNKRWPGCDVTFASNAYRG